MLRPASGPRRHAGPGQRSALGRGSGLGAGLHARGTGGGGAGRGLPARRFPRRHIAAGRSGEVGRGGGGGGWEGRRGRPVGVGAGHCESCRGDSGLARACGSSWPVAERPDWLPGRVTRAAAARCTGAQYGGRVPRARTRAAAPAEASGAGTPGLGPLCAIHRSTDLAVALSTGSLLARPLYWLSSWLITGPLLSSIQYLRGPQSARRGPAA